MKRCKLPKNWGLSETIKIIDYLLYIQVIAIANYLSLFFRQEEFVRQKKAETFRGRGKTETLEDHGEESLEVKLDVLCKTYQWEQCLERAKSNDELFSKYLAKYVTHICKTRSPQHALNIYAVEYGPLIHKQHLNLYRAMASLIINNVAQDEFEIWSKFRDVFLGVVSYLVLMHEEC